MTTIAINPSLVSATPAKSELRLTPRGRALARLAVVASLSILLLSGFSIFNGASASSDASVTSPYIKISVKPGETLWSIAAMVASEGDRRDMVAEIVEVNHLKNPELYAGQKLYIPTRR